MPEKFEREIDEILRRASFDGPSRRSRRRQPSWTSGPRDLWQRYATNWTPARLMALGIALAFLGYFLREIVPSFTVLITLVSLVLLGGGLVMSISGRGHRPVQGWRGRIIDMSPRHEPFWTSWVRRWRAWRRGWK